MFKYHVIRSGIIKEESNKVLLSPIQEDSLSDKESSPTSSVISLSKITRDLDESEEKKQIELNNLRFGKTTET